MESRVDCDRKEKHRGEIRSRDCVSSPREGEGETGARVDTLWPAPWTD